MRDNPTNRFGVDVKRGAWVIASHPRGGDVSGRVVSIKREDGRGTVVKLDSGFTVALDDVQSALGRMTVGRDGTVKQNPIPDPSDQQYVIQVDGEPVTIDPGPDYQGRLFGPPFKVYPGDVDPGYFVYGTSYKDGRLQVIRMFAWPAGPRRKWPKRSRLAQPGFRTKAQALAVLKYLNENDYGPNPAKPKRTPRGPSKGPLSRPSQVAKAAPSKRLLKRRRLTAEMRDDGIEGVYANPGKRKRTVQVTPAPQRFAVMRKLPRSAKWEFVALFEMSEFARVYARALHGAHPTWAIKVEDI